MQVQSADYYSDNFIGANKIDADKGLCGIINASTDIDIVKFTPTATGLYTLQVDASGCTVCGLYNNAQTLLNSVSASNNSDYLLCSLSANQDYYIRFNGNVNNSYEITPPALSEHTTIEKNIGRESDSTNSNYYNIYKFIPPTTGSYIITAVDSSDVKADLYNSAFVRVASSSESDASVSFRITYNMVANQVYYIVVYPKTENASGSYTMYAEEPFALISVE